MPSILRDTFIGLTEPASLAIRTERRIIIKIMAMIAAR